jgi:hypothetical protein
MADTGEHVPLAAAEDLNLAQAVDLAPGGGAVGTGTSTVRQPTSGPASWCSSLRRRPRRRVRIPAGFFAYYDLETYGFGKAHICAPNCHSANAVGDRGSRGDYRCREEQRGESRKITKDQKKPKRAMHCSCQRLART